MRVSAFTGSDLDVLLRANEIETMVMFGIATSGVVLSTLLHAVDADYRTSSSPIAAPTPTRISTLHSSNACSRHARR